MAQAEPEALRLLAPRRGLFATVESKSKNNSKNAESKTREYSWNCQTSTASPAEPGGLPFRLGMGSARNGQHPSQGRKIDADSDFACRHPLCVDRAARCLPNHHSPSACHWALPHHAHLLYRNVETMGLLHPVASQSAQTGDRV